MKKFNQLAKKNYLKFFSGIKAKVAIKFPKKPFFSAENRLGAERVNSLAHQPFEKLGQIPCETSIEKCVTGVVSHIIFWR